MKRILSAKFFGIIAIGVLFVPAVGFCRDLNYVGQEETIYVTPGEPTQLQFPSKVEGGYKRKQSSVSLDRKDNFLIVFSGPDLSLDGEAIIVHLDDKRTYALRVMPSSEYAQRDEVIKIIDERDPDPELQPQKPESEEPTGFAPASTVSGLMRNMVLVAEFGKGKGIPGFRRSNKYSGEVVLHDGTLKATIDELFLGPDLWGYVISVENMLEVAQRINPASFRLDGTRAISASNWELAPRPLTAEQEISNAHVGKVYIVTKAKR